jgi:succinate dehydrogenase membrane anchor subunit
MRNVGGAHRGLNLWLVQRVSALWIGLFLPAFLIYAAAQGGLDYVAWRGLFQPAAVKVAAWLFAAALFVHAWVGLREIFIDYVHPLAIRLPLYFLFALVYGGCLVWAAAILWGTG